MTIETTSKTKSKSQYTPTVVLIIIVAVGAIVATISTYIVLVGIPGVTTPAVPTTTTTTSNPSTSTSTSSSSNNYNYPPPSETTTTNPQQQPTVYFPTPEQVAAYNMELASKINTIATSAQGEINTMKVATKGQDAYVAWLGKIDGMNHVFYTMSRDNGYSFTQPIELSPSAAATTATAASASNLQLAVYGSYVDIVWQSGGDDPALNGGGSGSTNIIGSVSMDNGVTFKTYQLNEVGTKAWNPLLPGNFIATWQQDKGPCDTTGTTTTTTTPQDEDDGGVGCLRFMW